MNTAAKGNVAELAVAAELSAQGWCCASRRHIGGAGDLLVVHPRQRTRLIEVKAEKNSPWQHFGRESREALRAEAERIDADPLLAWRRNGKTTWLTDTDWP